MALRDMTLRAVAEAATKGPWRVEDDNPTGIVGADCCFVADVMTQWDAAQTAANAQLLALAYLVPELVEALEACANRLEKCALMNGTSPEFAAVAVADYRAVLAKVV